MQTVYLHLGYHKTATTFLQHTIFPELKHVNYIKKEWIKETFRKVRLKKLTNSEIDDIRDDLDSYNNGQPILISYEGLSGSPFSPKKTKKQSKVLEDLRRIFPASDYEVHCIIGIREQVDLLTSLYVQHLHQGGVLNAQDYIKYCEHNGSLQNFHFHRYLQRIEDIFGHDSIYVMVYEFFKQHFTDELLKLLNYMGEPEIPSYKDERKWHNKSFGKFQVAVARRFNRFFKTPIHPQGRLPIIEVPVLGPLSPRRLLQNKYSFALHYKKYEFSVDLQTSLKLQFREGNYKLKERYNLDLPYTYLS